MREGDDGLGVPSLLCILLSGVFFRISSEFQNFRNSSEFLFLAVRTVIDVSCLKAC